MQNILLACRVVGIGAALTTAHCAFGDEVDELFGLTAETPSCALILIGWPKGRMFNRRGSRLTSVFLLIRWVFSQILGRPINENRSIRSH